MRFNNVHPGTAFATRGFGHDDVAEAVLVELTKPGRCACGTRRTGFRQRRTARGVEIQRWCRRCDPRRRAAVAAGSAAALRGLVGYVVRWDDCALLADGTRERILPHAFDHLPRAGWPIYLDHERTRRVNGGVHLAPDACGLRARITIFDGDQSGLLAAARSGRTLGASIGFDDEGSVSHYAAPPRRERSIARVSLVELSIVMRGHAAYRRSWLALATPANEARANREQREAAAAALDALEVS